MSPPTLLSVLQHADRKALDEITVYSLPMKSIEKAILKTNVEFFNKECISSCCLLSDETHSVTEHLLLFLFASTAIVANCLLVLSLSFQLHSNVGK